MTIRPDTHIHIPEKTAVLDTKFAAESYPNVRFVNRRPYLAHPVPTWKRLGKFSSREQERKNALFSIAQYGLDPSNAISNAPLAPLRAQTIIVKVVYLQSWECRIKS